MNADKPLTTIADRLQWVWDQVASKQTERLTQAAFGDPLGVTGAAVGQWLSGSTKQPTAEKLFAIEDHYGYTARWIATGEGARTVEVARQVLALAEMILAAPGEKQKAIATLLQPDEKPDGPGSGLPMSVQHKRINMQDIPPHRKRQPPKSQKNK